MQQNTPRRAESLHPWAPSALPASSVTPVLLWKERAAVWTEPFFLSALSVLLQGAPKCKETSWQSGSKHCPSQRHRAGTDQTWPQSSAVTPCDSALGPGSHSDWQISCQAVFCGQASSHTGNSVLCWSLAHTPQLQRPALVVKKNLMTRNRHELMRVTQFLLLAPSRRPGRADLVCADAAD